MYIQTTMKLRFSVQHGEEKLSWTSNGNNTPEQAPEWITKSDMFKATARAVSDLILPGAAVLTVLNTSPIIKSTDLKPKKAKPDDSTESI